jgi:hypothetical protein
MILRFAVCAVVLAFPTVSFAQSAEVRVIEATDLAPAASLRPDARPGGTPIPRSGAAPSALGAALPDAPNVAPAAEAAAPQRPRGLAGLFRPRGETGANTGATVVRGGGSSLAIASSVRPRLRPDGLETEVRAAATRNLPGAVAQPGRSSGTLCGVVGLQGDQIEPVTGRISGCGIPSNAVRLRVVHGITLTSPATINCGTAQAVSQWVLDAEDIVGNTGGGMANLRVVASYACRTRNSRAGARLSEHATGNAVDIAGIGLQNGSELSVLNDWRNGNASIMRGLHEAACGTFGTVLGPESDRFHQDHFHFDVASYRSGAYCR